MSHIHNIVDTDSHFRINPITREVTTKADKLFVVQYDHNSERFTFQIPRYVEEHDMALCDRIEIHYSNIIRNKKQQNDDVYYVKDDDRQSDYDTMFFSWLISSNATQLVGSLKFSVTFVCLNDDGTVRYEWSTAMFENVQVLTKLENAALVRDKYPDLYTQLKQEIIDSIPSTGGEIDPKEIEKIVLEYLAANPPSVENAEDGYSPTIDVTKTEVGHNLVITDVNGIKTIEVLNGTNGEDGVSPTIEVSDIENGHLLTITDKTGIKTIEVLNGKDAVGGGDPEDIKQMVDDFMEENSKNAVIDF